MTVRVWQNIYDISAQGFPFYDNILHVTKRAVEISMLFMDICCL